MLKKTNVCPVCGKTSIPAPLHKYKIRFYGSEKRVCGYKCLRKWEYGINTCICCGEIIPEGRQVCPKCEKGEMHDKV